MDVVSARYRRVDPAGMLKVRQRQKGDSMPFLMTRVLVLAVSVGIHSTIGHAEEPLSVTSVQSENLLRETIDDIEGKEVIVSRVSFPPRFELPWHWHPGEEFFYVIEGSVTLKRRGHPDAVTVRGDSQKIAPGVIHSGESGEEGAELVIFRVHASGEPERYLVE